MKPWSEQLSRNLAGCEKYDHKRDGPKSESIPIHKLPRPVGGSISKVLPLGNLEFRKLGFCVYQQGQIGNPPYKNSSSQTRSALARRHDDVVVTLVGVRGTDIQPHTTHKYHGGKVLVNVKQYWQSIVSLQKLGGTLASSDGIGSHCSTCSSSVVAHSQYRG